MKAVKYAGDNPTLRKGQTALMRDDGKVQIDGAKDIWRASDRADPRCFGWHDLGDQWEPMND